MSRARVPDGLLAALATVLVGWPLVTLFSPNTWVAPTLALVLLVMLAGMAARAVTTSGALTVLGQLVALLLGASWLHGRGHLWHALPTPDTALAFNNLLVDALHTIQTYTAPAPTNRGVILAVGLAIGLTAIVVDYLAVTRCSPALAGLPLFTAYLISAANSGAALHWRFFVAPAVVWLAMVGRQGVAGMRRWSTALPRTGTGRVVDDSDSALGFAAFGRALGVGGLVLALIVPAVLPHLPTRFLIDGLGRSSSATGFSDGQVGLSNTLDLTKSLKDPATSPVLSYRTSDPSPGPLRVEVLDDYQSGRWSPRRRPVIFARHPAVSAPGGIEDQVKRTVQHIDVKGNRVQPPQLAAPYPVTGGRLGGVAWGVDDTQSVRVDGHADDYSMDFLVLDPSRSLLQQPLVGDVNGFAASDDLRVPPEVEALLRRTLAKIVPGGATRVEAATAIQQYLRGPDFTYSLDLPEQVLVQQGKQVGPDPLSQFLTTKRGYCVQFASAMVMLSRASGVPARLAIGFLPGTPDRGTYTVRAADAHAWPELYFDGVGWLRFEPTPATRTGAPPAYTAVSTPGSGSTATTAPGSTAAPTAGATPKRPGGANDPAQGDLRGRASSPGGLAGWWASVRSLPWPVWLLLALVGALLAMAGVPVAGHLTRRRELLAARDDAERAEVSWQGLLRGVDDLGLEPPIGGTPRQTAAFLRHEAYLGNEPSAALGRLVSSLERARYAPPGTPISATAEDARAVLAAVRATRRTPEKLHALVLPQEGRQQWGELGLRISELPGRLWRRARVRLVRPLATRH